MISLFRRNPGREAALLAYSRVVEQARRPVFYADYGVPDSLDGRFELICLHAFLYLQRLKRERDAGAPLGQSFFDEMFGDFDRCLREMGTGDLGVGRQVNRMAEAFYGRIKAYEEGLEAGSSLAAALARNLYGTASADEDCLAALADYTRAQARALSEQTAAALLAGDVRFGPTPPLRTVSDSGRAA
jgi:cytochrome b pre-mRNA-processing protein 3